MKYYLLTFNEDWADEHNVPALACFTETQYNSWLQKSQWEIDDEDKPENQEDDDEKHSKIHTYLGNSGDGFSENFEYLDYMKAFVEDGCVEVLEVTKEFYNLFKQANLSNLSLCNIFKL